MSGDDGEAGPVPWRGGLPLRTVGAASEFLLEWNREAVRLRRVVTDWEGGFRREEIRSGAGLGAGSAGLSTAGRVTSEFSARSRRAMRWAFGSLAWEDCGERVVMVTLTYGREFPLDGVVVKGHLQSFRKRWTRRFGAPLGAWAMEFQRCRLCRPPDGVCYCGEWFGAPHFHLYMGMPAGLGAWEFEAWAAEAWFEIVQGAPVGDGWRDNSNTHLWHGVNVSGRRFGSVEENARRVGGYFFGESGKSGQKRPPEAYSSVGDYWGVWGGLRRVEGVQELSYREGVAVRRPLVALRDSLAGEFVFRRPRGVNGLTVHRVDAGVVAPRLVGWVKGEGVERAE